jgi:hypothetical protein
VPTYTESTHAESLSNINRIIHDFHLIDNSGDYSRFIDELKLSEIEVRQNKEIQILDKAEKINQSEAANRL